MTRRRISLAATMACLMWLTACAARPRPMGPANPDRADAPAACTASPPQRNLPRARAIAALPPTDGVRRPALLLAFRRYFPEAADLIAVTPPALQFVGEADKKYVRFGGYAEYGPGGALGRAYTQASTVYVPVAEEDPVLAARDFLFELNNALRLPRTEALVAAIARGGSGRPSAPNFAYRAAEIETEGALRLGQLWTDIEKFERSVPGDRLDGEGDPRDPWYHYPDAFFVRVFAPYAAKRVTKATLVKSVLRARYSGGCVNGLTVEDYYRQGYRAIVQAADKQRATQPSFSPGPPL